MNSPNNNTPLSQQSCEQFQELVQEWISQMQRDNELQKVGTKDQQSKDHWNKQSKHMKDISSKLNKLERQLLRQESGVIKGMGGCGSKSSDGNTNRATQLLRLLQRATSLLSESRRVDQQQLDTQIRSIYNAAISQLEKRQRLQSTLTQLRKTQMQLQEQLQQTNSRKTATQKQIGLMQAQHRLKQKLQQRQ